MLNKRQVFFRNFNAAQKKVPNHYPEQKNWILCLLIWAWYYNFSAEDSDLAHFLSFIEISEKKNYLYHIIYLFKIWFFFWQFQYEPVQLWDGIRWFWQSRIFNIWQAWIQFFALWSPFPFCRQFDVYWIQGDDVRFLYGYENFFENFYD